MMLEIIVICIASSYCLLLLYFIAGNLKKRTEKLSQERLPISIIIPFRNEEKKLGDLIRSFKKQDYPATLLEFIFINDFSTDKGLLIIESEMKGLNYRIINLKERSGKKEAVKIGIQAAKNELIITTDADTTRGEKWLTKMVQHYTPNSTKLVVGPVLYPKGDNFWQKIQAMEFAALIATTQGAIAQNNSYLCNGANLLFGKQTYLSLKEEELKLDISSGDDVFLLHAIKKKWKERDSIVFVSSADAIVYTEGCKTVKGFVQQRLRWVGKSRYYADLFSVMVGFFVVPGNIALLIAFLFIILGQLSCLVFLAYFLLKWGVEATLLYSIKSWSGFKVNIFHTFLLSIFYPLYIISLAFLSLLFKVEWKGRKIK